MFLIPKSLHENTRQNKNRYFLPCVGTFEEFNFFVQNIYMYILAACGVARLYEECKHILLREHSWIFPSNG